MAPIRVGFIGLSKSGWAPGAHLPYLKASDKYEITAICNSSVDSSKEAIKLYGLPESTKAYGDPEDIAKDPNVDLVVCSVRVDRHVSTISPALKAGKDVYVEWPLGKSAAEARTLLKLKDEGKVKHAVVGLQARQAPILNKVKALIDSGKIGKVLSSTWTGQAGNGGPEVSQSTEYLVDKKVGGNLVTIHFGHSIDYIQHVLGYGFSSRHSVFAARRPTVKLVDKEGKVIDANHPKDTDDTIFLNGTLKTGIPLSFSLRGGKPFKGTPGLDWRIYGLKGEIRITSSGPFLQIGYPDMKIEVHDFEKDEIEEQKIPTDDLDELGTPGRNVGRVYKELSEGRVNCSFEDAVERHELIEALYKENGYTEV